VNRKVPQRDRRDRGSDPRWEYGLARSRPGVGGLVGGIETTASPIGNGPRCATVGPRALGARAGHPVLGVRQKQKGPPGACQAGQEGGKRLMLLVDAVGALAALRFEGLDGAPSLLIAPAMNPPTAWFCQPILSMISESLAPFFRWSIATTCAVLLPSLGPAVSCAFAAFLRLGAFLAAVAFLVALAFAGAPLAGRCVTFGLAFRLRLRRLAESLDALHIRLMAVARFDQVASDRLASEVLPE
jgi:hypothetical protein